MPRLSRGVGSRMSDGAVSQNGWGTAPNGVLPGVGMPTGVSSCPIAPTYARVPTRGDQPPQDRS
jgi:hypothetical protein